MSYGSLAAGGTLGILIPPSIPMILYGSFTETSVAKLFMAGVVPGALLAAIFMIYIGVRSVLLAENAAQPDEGRLPMLTVIGQLLPFMLLMTMILGGIYAGWATPTEAAALVAPAKRRLTTIRRTVHVLTGTAAPAVAPAME
jgi:TRAP-type C4-dicarboxylate transport system permease large subunit